MGIPITTYFKTSLMMNITNGSTLVKQPELSVLRVFGILLGLDHLLPIHVLDFERALIDYRPQVFNHLIEIDCFLYFFHDFIKSMYGKFSM